MKFLLFFLMGVLFFANLTFSQIYILIVGLDYKPALKPFIEKEIEMISRNWGKYRILTPESFKNTTFTENDTLIVLGEYYGFKLYPKGRLNWLILDYCLSCESIDLKKVNAKHILCTESKIPAYGFYFLYSVKNLSPEAVKSALIKTLKYFRYGGEIGTLKIRLFNKD